MKLFNNQAAQLPIFPIIPITYLNFDLRSKFAARMPKKEKKIFKVIWPEKTWLDTSQQE
jgi:hypothetical protein